MPTTHPLAIAVRDADRKYSRFDRHRDRETLRRIVTQLAAQGFTNAEIAPHVGLQTKQVNHITSGRINTSHKPAPVNPRDYSDRHCRQLEHTATIAIDLACRLRDEDPQIVWDALTALNRRHLQELAVIALAAIPVNTTKNEIFAWVNKIGEQL